MNHLTFDELLKYAKRSIKEMHDEQGNLKTEYKNLIDKVNNHIKICQECNKIIIKLQQTNSMEEIQRIRAEYEYKTKIEGLTEKEKISKKYGINLSSIEHIKLQDGKEYYHFYDFRLNKDVILRKNQENKNMSEEFKEIQEDLSVAQGTNEQSNGEEVFRYQRLYTNNEVKLYSVDELITNQELLNQINKEQMKAVLVLLKNKDILRIKQINPETGIAIDDSHKIITSYYNEKTKNYEVSTPNQYEYKIDKVVATNQENDISNSELETSNNIESTYDIPTEIDGIVIDPERVKLYYEYPELLDRQDIVSLREKEAYIKAIEKYTKILESRQNSTGKDKPKMLVKKDKNALVSEDNQKQGGFINLLLLALTTGFAGGIITAIMYSMIK